MKLITVKEAAEVLNCKPSTIYALCERREIPHYRVGKSLRFNPEELFEKTKVEPVRARRR